MPSDRLDYGTSGNVIFGVLSGVLLVLSSLAQCLDK